MRAQLNKQAEVALRTLHNRFKEANPDVEPSEQLFLNKIIQHFDTAITDAKISRLASLFTSTKLIKKRRQQILRELCESVDEKELVRLQIRVKTREKQDEKSQKNEPNSAETR